MKDLQVSELRVGNWASICKVEYIHQNKPSDWHTVEMCLDFLYDIDRDYLIARPIPLTEEWLEKFGLLKGGNKYGNTFHVMNDDGFSAKYTIEHWTDEEAGIHKGKFHWVGIGGAPLEYVHQFQNLYFALTGQELANHI